MTCITGPRQSLKMSDITASLNIWSWSIVGWTPPESDGLVTSHSHSRWWEKKMHAHKTFCKIGQVVDWIKGKNGITTFLVVLTQYAVVLPELEHNLKHPTANTCWFSWCLAVYYTIFESFAGCNFSKVLFLFFALPFWEHHCIISFAKICLFEYVNV